jgi:hypothetical protein
MRDKGDTIRFGPGRWVTLRETGEHVQVECWSAIKSAYRVRSRKSGQQFAIQDDLMEISPHPDTDRGKYWPFCPAPGCGAPLTPDLLICPLCQGPTCACGRCQCAKRTAKPTRAKAPRARAAKSA